MGGRIEDFARILRARRHDNESRKQQQDFKFSNQNRGRRDGHVEDTESAQRSGVPLLHVAFHCRIHRVCEFTNDGDSPAVTRKMFFFISIHGLFEGKKSENDGKCRISPSGDLGGGQ
jgi:hypothetical protein